MFARPMVRMVLAVSLVVLALAAYKAYSIKQMLGTLAAPKPAISISATRAKQTLWSSKVAAVGTLKALQGVDLSVEVSGTVSEINFSSGQAVTQGTRLLALDSRTEQASLATAEAALGLAELEHARGNNLIHRQAISKSEFDRLNAELKKAQAAVAQLRATLDKRTLRAPFSGVIGIRQVDVGAYVTGGTPIATLQDLSSLYVDFYLPEQYAPSLMLGQEVEVAVAAFKDQRFSANISAINPKVDDSTRALLVRATLANPEQKLLPGMFAELNVIQQAPKPQIVVPETAVAFTLYGTSVYQVVKADDVPEGEWRVVRQYVKTGERRDGQVVILEGLKVDDQVVVSGQLKLDNNSHVRIENDPAQNL